MVLQKRSEYGFHGYQIPTMPTGCRSARKKRTIRYSVINTANLCAIDLLASVAGELLLEKEDAAATVVPPQQQQDDKRPVKVEPCNQGNGDKAAPLIQYQKRLPHKHMFKEANSPASSPCPPFLGVMATATAAAARGDTKPGPLFRHSPPLGASASPKLENEDVAAASIPIWINNNTSNNSGNVKGPSDQGNMENKAATGKESMDVDIKPPAPPLASSDSSVEVPATYCSPRNNFMRRSSSIPRIHDKSLMHHDGRDKDADEDDENSSACTHPSTVSPRAATASSAFRPQRIGDRRIRKLLSPRFWKVGQTRLKEGEFCDRDMFRSKKLSYTRLNTQRSSFKRRKLFQRNSFSSSSAGIATKTVSKLSSDYNNKSIKGEQGNETSSSITSPKTSFKSEGYQVKLKIKSFKVPELFIEMPESATVGALKRAVLETVTTMLGNGLKVGVIYQGRKVRDDSRTLSQAGIGGGEMLDSLNFSLEPAASSGGASSSALLQNTPGSSSCRAEAPLTLEEQCRSPRPLAVRLPDFRADTTKNAVKPDARELPPQQQGQPKVVGFGSPSNKALAVSSDCPADDASGAIVPISSTLLSKALVPVNPSPSLSSSELALSVVPVSNKSTRRPETGQRRIRRPFSVAEVEALVEAVEKLGTGRWRDVKLQAFENAKHRTYVDLKDKWKTLVHTARISPQQRRGEPVPQELLDRVLVAHAHWSQHQARLQSSKQAGNTHGGGSGTVHQQQQPNNSCHAAGLLLPPPPTLEQLSQPAAALI